ncbi:hypothetical protein D9M71_410780 [compost metagenome]
MRCRASSYSSGGSGPQSRRFVAESRSLSATARGQPGARSRVLGGHQRGWRRLLLAGGRSGLRLAGRGRDGRRGGCRRAACAAGSRWNVTVRSGCIARSLCNSLAEFVSTGCAQTGSESSSACRGKWNRFSCHSAVQGVRQPVLGQCRLRRAIGVLRSAGRPGRRGA